MEKSIGKEIDGTLERMQFLSDNCDQVENKCYMKRFSQEEIAGQKDVLSEISIEIKDIEDRKREASRLFKLELDPLVEKRKTIVSDLKAKARLVEEKTYKFVDRESRMVGWYNAEGDLVDSRPANMDELPENIFSASRAAAGMTGTNN